MIPRRLRRGYFPKRLANVGDHYAHLFNCLRKLQELQDLLDELAASRASRKRAWENLAAIRWVIEDTVGIELPPLARKTIDLEGRIVKDGVKKALGGPPASSG